MAAKKKNDIVLDEELNRAAQFLPFDALKGLGAELRKREEKHNYVGKPTLTEEYYDIDEEQLCLIFGKDD